MAVVATLVSQKKAMISGTLVRRVPEIDRLGWGFREEREVLDMARQGTAVRLIDDESG
jgi:hypothetical protein